MCLPVLAVAAVVAIAVVVTYAAGDDDGVGGVGGVIHRHGGMGATSFYDFGRLEKADGRKDAGERRRGRRRRREAKRKRRRKKWLQELVDRADQKCGAHRGR